MTGARSESVDKSVWIIRNGYNRLFFFSPMRRLLWLVISPRFPLNPERTCARLSRITGLPTSTSMARMKRTGKIGLVGKIWTKVEMFLLHAHTHPFML